MRESLTFMLLAMCCAGVLMLSSCSDDDSDSGTAAEQEQDADTGNGDSGDDGSDSPDETTQPSFSQRILNKEAVIPPQCYTKTDGHFNPCYVCHQDAVYGEGRANLMDDGELQGEYTFSDEGLTNFWSNLFVDRSAAVAAIPDDEIIEYVSQDNYSPLLERLNADASFDGWIPDVANLAYPDQAFDENGLAKDGSWWVAFNYKPLPSTFWPTNGSTDDVMIRLPPKFWQDSTGADSLAIYWVNLAIVEAALKNYNTMTLPAIDENEIGIDLNGDAVFTVVTELVRPGFYVGGAADVPVVTFLYPEGTEFLHTVRYVGVDEAGNISNPPRMKEVRYMRKSRFYNKAFLGNFYDEEAFEKEQGMLPRVPNHDNKGVKNGMGWDIQGFIEDADGELRIQTYEEHFFCVGCHKTVGATLDQTFAFGRKIDGKDGWGYINLKGMQDVPRLGETEAEVLQYLKRVGGGDEFRQNQEMIERWFKSDGTVDEVKVTAAADVYELLTPSRRRALDLNKAYRTIVKEQSFIRGRDATILPSTNVFEIVDPDVVPLDPEFRFNSDSRLAWQDGLP